MKDYKGQEAMRGVMDKATIVTVVVISQMQTYVRTQIVHFKHVQFILCCLYLNKAVNIHKEGRQEGRKGEREKRRRCREDGEGGTEEFTPLWKEGRRQKGRKGRRGFTPFCHMFRLSFTVITERFLYRSFLHLTFGTPCACSFPHTFLIFLLPSTLPQPLNWQRPETQTSFL